MKLTAAQKRLLETASRSGHALAETGCKSLAGGATRRCALRLADMGLLTRHAPFRLTDAGRNALPLNTRVNASREAASR